MTFERPLSTRTSARASARFLNRCSFVSTYTRRRPRARDRERVIFSVAQLYDGVFFASQMRGCERVARFCCVCVQCRRGLDWSLYIYTHAAAWGLWILRAGFSLKFAVKSNLEASEKVRKGRDVWWGITLTSQTIQLYDFLKFKYLVNSYD